MSQQTFTGTNFGPVIAYLSAQRNPSQGFRRSTKQRTPSSSSSTHAAPELVCPIRKPYVKSCGMPMIRASLEEAISPNSTTSSGPRGRSPRSPACRNCIRNLQTVEIDISDVKGALE